MTSALQEQPGVTISGQHWEVEDFLLFQSTDEDTILFVPKQPRLMQDSEHRRYQATLTQFLRWQERDYTVTGGSALFSITTVPHYDTQALQQLKERWRRVVLNMGFTGAGEPRFVPLSMRNLRVEVVIGTASGKPTSTSGAADGGLSSETVSIAIDLTAQGAQQWGQGVSAKGAIPGAVRVTYEYPQLLPAVEALARVLGPRVFTYLSNVLDRNEQGIRYGSEAEIRAAWSAMVQNGDVQIVLTDDLPSELEPRQQELLDTFAEQARQHFFERLFAPLPPAEVTPSNNGQRASTPLYALRWRQRADATTMSLTLKFEAWNWLTGSMEADFTTLLAPLDAGYLNRVYTEVSVPVTLVVEPDPLVTSVAAALTYSAGRAPDAPVFGQSGGTVQYLLTTSHPDTVTVQYTAQVNFAPRNWPIITTSGEKSLAAGEEHITLKPGSWVRRHTIYMYVRDGNRIKRPGELTADDYLVLNVVYQVPGIAPIRESARITPLTPVVFNHPISPSNGTGRAKLSAMGVVGGRAVRSPELEIDPNEDAIYILADRQGLQLVSKQAVMAEDDALVQRLRESGARPVIQERSGTETATYPETGNGAVSEAGQSIYVDYAVPLIPQPTNVSCWAAALAMVVSFRDYASYAPETIAAQAGMDLYTGYDWWSIRRAVITWQLRERGPASAMPAEWSRLLRMLGPLWIVEVGAPYHAVVLSGIAGDGTPNGSWVTVYNPWPPTQGAIEYKWFTDFDAEFGLGAGADSMIVHA